MNLLAFLKPFRQPTATDLAAQQLEDARRLHLKELSAAEYHASQAAYYAGMITRLSTYTKERTK